MHQVDSMIHRHRNVTILVAVLFAQVLGLAVQVRRQTDTGGSARLVRLWATAIVTPIEKGFVAVEHSAGDLWHNYVYLRGVRRENAELKLQLDQMRIEQTRLREDAGQAHRLQNLLGFKEQFVSQTQAAQVIGSSGSDQSRLLYLDKGSDDGIKADMAVVTPDGVVGKVIRAFGHSSQVMLISDQLSGVGAMLEKSRLQGVVRGTPSGSLLLRDVMSDEKVEVGDLVLSSGGDRVFPKGMPIGRVKTISSGPELFYNIELQPAANLGRLEEVLVITKLEERSPKVDTAGPMRAADVRADRLPTVPPAARTDANGTPLPTSNLPAPGASASASKSKPAVTAGTTPATASNTQPKPKSPQQTASAKPKPAASAPANGTIPETNATGVAPKNSSTTQLPNSENNGKAKPAGDSTESPSPAVASPKLNDAVPVTDPSTAKPKRITDEPATGTEAPTAKPPKQTPPQPPQSSPSTPQSPTTPQRGAR